MYNFKQRATKLWIYTVYIINYYRLKEKNQDKKIQRRIMAGWAAYAKHRDIFKSNLAILPEETGVQLLFAARYDKWCRDLGWYSLVGA